MAPYVPPFNLNCESQVLPTPSHSESTRLGGKDNTHRYRHLITSDNPQHKREVRLTDRLSKFRCPVVGCDYVQKNRRVPDLKRHTVTHDCWLEPDKWICCGVAIDNAHLYGIAMEKGTNEEELAKAGVYMFRGKLMVGGCSKTFARRDALKRHVDNSNILCVGDMDLYFY